MEQGASCDVGNGRTTPICRPKAPTVRERGRGSVWGWRLQFRDDGSSEAMVTVSIQHPSPYRPVGQEMLTAEFRRRNPALFGVFVATAELRQAELRLALVGMGCRDLHFVGVLLFTAKRMQSAVFLVQASGSKDPQAACIACRQPTHKHGAREH